jgi:hypothetical protein
MLSFVVWHRKTFGTAGLPILEHRAYEFLTHLRSTNAKPTKAANFVSALSFGAYVLGIAGALDASTSIRVKGAAHSQFIQKKPLKQKRKLTADELRVLEHLTINAEDVRDKVASGFFTSQFHTRGRFSDLQFSKHVIPDFQADGGGFLEFKALDVKTSTSMQAKCTFMPLTAPAVGVSRTSWAESWFQTLLDQKLVQESELEAGTFVFVKKFVLPETLRDGTWGDHPCSSQDAGFWLRELLSSAGIPNVSKEIGTHSLKSTPLAWAAMFGLSITDRELLGHHSLGNHRSALTYSRDAQARPLQLYSKILRAISDGSFDPDATRSGRFYSKRQRTDPKPGKGESEEVSEAVVERTDLSDVLVDETLPLVDIESEVNNQNSERLPSVDDTSQSSTSESSDSDESVQSSDETRRAVNIIRTRVSELDADCAVFFHSRSNVVHYREKDSVNRLRCGRVQNLAYVKIKAPYDQVSLKFVLLCKQCFGS